MYAVPREGDAPTWAKLLGEGGGKGGDGGQLGWEVGTGNVSAGGEGLSDGARRVRDDELAKHQVVQAKCEELTRRLRDAMVDNDELRHEMGLVKERLRVSHEIIEELQQSNKELETTVHIALETSQMQQVNTPDLSDAAGKHSRPLRCSR